MSCLVQEQNPVYTCNSQAAGQKKLAPNKTNKVTFSWVNIFCSIGRTWGNRNRQS